MLGLTGAAVWRAQSFFHVQNSRMIEQVSGSMLYRCMSCAFLAAKLEHSKIRLRSILFVFDRLLKREQNLPLEPLNTFSTRYRAWSRGVLACEETLLRILGYSTSSLNVPQTFVVHYVHCLEDEQKQLWNEVIRRVHSCIFDSGRTAVCIQYPAHVIAVAAIHLTCRFMQIPLPNHWYQLFDCTEKEMHACAMQLGKFYVDYSSPIRYNADNATDLASNPLCVLSKSSACHTIDVAALPTEKNFAEARELKIRLQVQAAVLRAKKLKLQSEQRSKPHTAAPDTSAASELRSKPRHTNEHRRQQYQTDAHSHSRSSRGEYGRHRSRSPDRHRHRRRRY